MRYYLPYFELSRSADGSAMYIGNKGNFGGDQYLGLDAIGNATVALMLTSTDGKLFLFGQKKKNWLSPSASAIPSKKPK